MSSWAPQKSQLREPRSLPAAAHMDHLSCLYAQRILAGTADVEGGCIRGVVAGDNGKESVHSVVEVLDEVCGILPVFHKVLI